MPVRKQSAVQAITTHTPPPGAGTMIVARNGRIEAKTGHDHERGPRCASVAMVRSASDNNTGCAISQRNRLVGRTPPWSWRPPRSSDRTCVQPIAPGGCLDDRGVPVRELEALAGIQGGHHHPAREVLDGGAPEQLDEPDRLLVTDG